jgi:formylglycine-generating enzyme required for sulfatase activity
MKRLFLIIAAAGVLQQWASANNLQITNISLTGADFVNHFTKIEFDVSWDNSWRDVINWDAVWIFAKYSTDLGLTWSQAWLNTTPGNHTIPGAAALSVGLTNISGNDRGIGVVLHRSVSGNGSISWTNVQLRWDYGLQSVGNYATIMIRVFGIEMVYVREGSYWLGDGATSDIAGQFEAGTGGLPFEMTGEGALTLGGGGAGSLGNNNAVGMTTDDDFNDATSKTLPADYPKGYNAFYCMKYEITQEQYRDFLNTLTRAQQENRVEIDINASPPITNRFVMTNTSTVYYRNGLRCDASPPSTGPIAFYCDYDGDGTYDEPGDGQNIPCNFVNHVDVKAYLDWSGLRPLTELEFEKACRGFISPVANELAWGNTNATAATGFTNAGQPTETASNTGANCTYNNGTNGVVRVGAFASGSTARSAAGASYWGVMEMSGNCLEFCVTVGTATHRSFTGVHGDGELAAGGIANVLNWPALLYSRLGSFGSQKIQLRVSDRSLSNYVLASRIYVFGGRGGRTAP